MDKLKKMSDAELIRFLREYNIPHGPIVESTRKLYEKKLHEFERTKKSSYPSTQSSYESKQQSSTRDTNTDDFDTYEEEAYQYSAPQLHQRGVRDDMQINSRIRENAYHDISQSPYSHSVEPRRPIRQQQARQEGPSQPDKRFLPLWVQLSLLLFFTGCLVYLYCRETNLDPFKAIKESLHQSKKAFSG